jgi:predicted ATPase/DNA-binding SARP family transcriptional activator
LTEAAMPSLSLRLLGTFQVLRDGAPITRFRGDKVRALLAYLATEADRPQARALLATLLWPEQGDDLALRNLAQALVRLRAALGDAGTLLDGTRDALGWRAAAYVDVPEFEQLARSVEVADLARAAELYGGEFLAGFSLPGCEAFEEWLLLRREQLHQLALSTLARLAELHERAGDYAALCPYARRQIALEPWHEAAHRQLMRGLALSGDRSAALAQYERCREVLANELGVEPDVETRALYERIRAEEFTPATRDVGAPRHNLPALLSPFVGRQAELAELAGFCAQPETRLLTLIGVGGIGKTRLALEVARASLDAYADGVFFVSLASLATASELPAAIAQALDLSLHGRDPATALLQFLRSKHLLLILDNFEHLLEGAELVVALLQQAPRLQILATSRARLNLRGEQIYVVQGLEYGAEAMPEEAATSAAVRLFAQAARRARPGFQVSEAKLPELLRICRLVYGMPLAIELAAAWAEMLSLAEIAQEIERSADFLTADWLDAPQRQRSMRAVFDWSWRLLSESERQVLRRLAVFRGGFTREAAEKVAGASLRVLSNLVHKSLLRRAEGSATGAGRYELHELLRQFAAEQLDAQEQGAAVRERHARYYLELVAGEEGVLHGHEARLSLAALGAARDNIRAAWTWAVGAEQWDTIEAGLHGFVLYTTMSGLVDEGVQSLAAAVARLRSTPQPERVRLLAQLLAYSAQLLDRQEARDPVITVAREAMALAQRAEDPLTEAHAALRLGWSLTAVTYAIRRIGNDEAVVWLQRAIAICRVTPGETPVERLRVGTIEAQALSGLSAAALAKGEYGRASAIGEAAVAAARSANSLLIEGKMLEIRAAALEEDGRFSEALAQRAAILAIMRTIGSPVQESIALNNLAGVQLYLGAYQEARANVEEAARMSAALGNELTFIIETLSVARAYDGDYVSALEAGLRALDLARGTEAAIGPLLAVADALGSLGRWSEAHERVAEAVEIGRACRMEHATVAALARLARCALALGDTTAALAAAEHILAGPPIRSLPQPFFPLRVALECYEALRAGGDPRAAEVLRAAHTRLRELAARIADPDRRRSFLEDVVAHRAILEAVGDIGCAARV